MSDNIQEVQVWPVNEQGEIVFEQGTGSTNITGYVSSSFIPVNVTSKKAVVKLPVTPITGIGDVPGLTAALNGKQNTLTGTGDVPGLTSALAGKQNTLTGTADVPGLTAALAAKSSVPITITAPDPIVVGSTLTAVFGTGWVATNIQWTRNGTNIPDAVNTTYTFAPEDSGATLAIQPTNLRYVPTLLYSLPGIGDSGSIFTYAATRTGILD